MLEAELDTDLGDPKYAIQDKQTSNSRAGRSPEILISPHGVERAIPRDREGIFDPPLC